MKAGNCSTCFFADDDQVGIKTEYNLSETVDFIDCAMLDKIQKQFGLSIGAYPQEIPGLEFASEVEPTPSM
jgi:hypothetical protein